MAVSLIDADGLITMARAGDVDLMATMGSSVSSQTVEDAVRSEAGTLLASADPIEAQAGRDFFGAAGGSVHLSTALGVNGWGLATLDGMTSLERAYGQYQAGNAADAIQTLQEFSNRLGDALLGGNVSGAVGGLSGPVIGSLLGGFLGNNAVFGVNAAAQSLEAFANAAYSAVHDLLSGTLTALGDAAGLGLDAIAELFYSPSARDPAAPDHGQGGAATAGQKMGEGNKQTSPLVLDLTGNGIHLKALAGNSPFFDLGATGFAHKTGWIGSGSGLLALDLNGNGVIDSGLELFGTAGGATDGFAALGALDSNHDGIIDASDAAFSQLRVWVDLNGDGITDPGELLTLDELGIASIGLSATTVAQSNAGNAVKLVGSYTLNDGTHKDIADVYFTNSLTFTKPDTPIALSPEVSALPGLPGYGAMLDLRSAAMADATLKAQLASLVANIGQDAQISLAAIKTLMLEWSHSTAINPASRGGLFDARQLDFLEKYTGIAFDDESYLADPAGQPSTPRWRSAVSLNEAWNSAYDSVAARLLLQSGYNLPEFTYDQADDMVLPATTWQASLASLFSRLGDISAANASQWGAALRVADAFRLDARLSPGAYLSGIASATSDSIAAMASALIYGETYAVDSNGMISLSGATEHAILYTGPSVRLVQITPPLSLAPPPLGNIVVYDAGNGTVEINAVDYSDAPNTMLLLGPNISPLQVKGTADLLGNLVLKLTDGFTADQIKLDGLLNSPANGIQTLRFADGTVWNRAQLLQFAMTGTSGADILYGTPGADTFDGKGGGDYAQGNGGNDTFVYNAGYGALEISETDLAAAPNNILRLGSGITAAQVRVTSDSAGNLILTDGIAGDQIKIDRQLSGSTYGIQGVQFADGSSWTRAQLIALASQITGGTGADLLYGTPGADTFDGRGGNDYEQGNGGNDTFLYDAGYGVLEISETDFASAPNNILKLGSGITAAQLKVTGDASGNLFLTDGIAGDQIKIDRLLSGSAYGVQGVRFADGSSWTRAQLVLQETTGTPAANTLYGTPGADTFDGNGGNDYEQGNGGNDTFLYNAGYGALEISETDYASAPNNILRLGAGITAAQVKVTGDASGNLLLTDGIAGDQIKIDRLLSGSAYGVQSVQFADGSSWTRAQLVQQETTGTIGADTLYGTPGADIFDGKGGNDTEYGNGGNDTFLFNRGYGQLHVNETDYGSNPNNVLEFGAGVSASDLWFARSNNDLVASVLGTHDAVTVIGFFSGTSKQVETIKADGSHQQLFAADINTLISQMAAFAGLIGSSLSTVNPAVLPLAYQLVVNAIWHPAS